jgi:hypothetical protein
MMVLVLRTQHDENALLLWESFKERLGQSKYSHMHFDLEALLTLIDDLESLVLPFSNVEIDDVVKDLKTDKYPGPDGFNTDFMKKCWDVIKSDFYDLYSGFFNHDICLQSINGPYITLIPKIDNPSRVRDFKPISLLNNSVKLLSKLLAKRLQKVILKIVHQNQYGFIKGVSIQDCLAWSFEYLHLCHKSKKELKILELDFEKAFDEVENEVIIQVLQHKGFPQKWLKWIKDILVSGASSIMSPLLFGSGETILFRQDLWNGHVMKVSFPHLHSFAKSGVITVSSVLQMESLQDHFDLSLSEIAFEQFYELSMILQSLPEDG